MTVQVRTFLSDDLHEALVHIKAKTRRSLADLLVDGAILLARFHDVGGSLPEPLLPAKRTDTERGTR